MALVRGSACVWDAGMLWNGCRVARITSHCKNGFGLRAFQKAKKKSRDPVSIDSRRDYGFNASLDSLRLYIPITVII